MKRHDEKAALYLDGPEPWYPATFRDLGLIWLILAAGFAPWGVLIYLALVAWGVL